MALPYYFYQKVLFFVLSYFYAGLYFALGADDHEAAVGIFCAENHTSKKQKKKSNSNPSASSKKRGGISDYNVGTCLWHASNATHTLNPNRSLGRVGIL